MADDTFRQDRQRITPKDLEGVSPPGPDPLQSVRKVQQAINQNSEQSSPIIAQTDDAPFNIEGNVPPGFKEAINRRQQNSDSATQEQLAPEQYESNVRYKKRQPKMKEAPIPDAKIKSQGSGELSDLLERLSEKHQWEEFDLCSCGQFYENISGKIHIRPMTGEEEQILATPRFVKKGQAIDMIFRRCIKENIDTEKLLSLDRTHLLIYLRGISYTPEYDVEIKCPECGMKFSSVINLDQLEVTACPSDFDPNSLKGVLPSSGFSYRYKLATGGDELEVTNYRDKRINMFGDQSEDDTLLYRTAILLEEIEGVTDRRELQVLLKKLPINDVSFLRNEINEPPFGVETEIEIVCPSCTNEFDIDLPLEANFFFPKKKEKAPA